MANKKEIDKAYKYFKSKKLNSLFYIVYQIIQIERKHPIYHVLII